MSIGDLSRSPRQVLGRVLKGERLIVCRHGHPVATLQPLDGCVTQPFDGTVVDLRGSPLGDIDREIAKLAPVEKKVLMQGIRHDRIVLARFSDISADHAVQGWELKGLARRTRRGRVLTGRGMVLREELLKRAGLLEELLT